MTKPILFDTETTGTDPEKDQIIEAAWLELPERPYMLKGSEDPSVCQRFKPSVPISYGAQAVHNIITSDLAGCPDPSEFALPEGIDYLIGHNVDFDWRFAGEPDIKRICTLAISRFLFPEEGSHTQSAMLYKLARRSNREAAMRERLKNAHAALDDVRNCKILLMFLLETAMDAGHACDTWEEVHALSETARIPTVMGFGKHKGTPIAQVDAGYVRWYRGQAETDPFYLEAFRRAGF